MTQNQDGRGEEEEEEEEETPLTFFGGTHSTRRYSMLTLPTSIGASLWNVSACMSMWSAPHSGQESVICTMTETWLGPVMHLPFHGPSRSTQRTSKHWPQPFRGPALKNEFSVDRAATDQ